MKTNHKNLFANCCLTLCAIVFSLLVLEAMVRKLDGFHLLSATLKPTQVLPSLPSTSVANDDVVKTYLNAIDLKPGIDKAWFDQPVRPLPNRTKPTEEIAARYRAAKGLELSAVYNWNRTYVRSEICRSGSQFEKLEKIDFFDDGTEENFPRYRFKKNITYPSGLVTNALGWRGRPMLFDKAKDVIRIAFVGSSTTVNSHGLPFSYPEYVEHWLNIWSASKGSSVRFETMNTAREGTNSEDFQAIVRKEIVPLNPDFVVYYEGSNQFWPVKFVRFVDGKMPPKPKITFTKPSGIGKYSALGIRVSMFFSPEQFGEERKKVWIGVDWPNDLDEFDPDLSYNDLPLNLDVIIRDLDRIRESLSKIDSKLIISSFVWLVEDGMVLKIPEHQYIYRYLNETFWPFPYHHMRRMADFQNRTFMKYAQTHGLSFLDVDSEFPPDPDLFSDAIHRKPDGVKLHGWIVFNKLVPLIEDFIERGQLSQRAQPEIVQPYTYEVGSQHATEWQVLCPKN